MSKGIWVSPNEFVSFAELQKPSKDAIATRARVNGSLGFAGALPNPDPVLRKMGKSIQVYRDLVADAHVGGCVRRRKSAVLALERGFDRENARTPVVDFVDRVFSKLRMRTVISEMLDAPLYGYTPLEVMWGDIDDRLVPVNVVAKPAEWFFFDDENRLRMRTKDDIYERLLMFCRSEVSIALTGTNQTTEADTTNASAQAGLTVSDAIRDADADLVSEAMNTLAQWTVELNFSEDEPVPVWSMWSPETIDKTRAERDQILKTAGANFTNNYFIREYNLKEGDLGEQLPPQQMGMGYPSFAENPKKPRDPVKVAADQLSRETQPIVDGWLERIRHFADKAKSMEELQERLLAEFDNLPEDELAAAMSSAFTVLNLQGRHEVNNGH